MMDALPEWLPPPPLLGLSPGEVHVWRIELEPSGEALEGFARTLAEEESRRAARFVFERDRRRFIAARGSLRRILGRYLDVLPEEVVFGYGPHGKPFLSGSLAEERGLRFNLSHSGEMALCALALHREVGIDLEFMHPVPDLQSIARSFFAPGENARLLSLPEERRPAAFFNCWTRKEAYLKALGDGLARPLGRFEVTLLPEEPVRLLSVTDDPREVQRWRMESFAPAPGYVAALIVEGQGWQPAFWQGLP